MFKEGRMSQDNAEIGVSNALISSIRTKVDGSVAVTLDLNPQDQSVINKLMNKYLLDRKLVTVAFVDCHE